MGFVSFLNIWGGKKAKEEAEKFAGIESALELKLTGAKIADLKQEERVLAGTTRARAAGSGVKADTGSPLTILAEQARNFAKDRMITAQVGATKASNVELKGKMVGRQALYQGWQQGLTNLSKSLPAAFGIGG